MLISGKKTFALCIELSEALEGVLKPEEMLLALKNMKNGKSPELDGFTTEFYNFFWSDLKFQCHYLKLT
jgi:hypothetical protein